MKLHSRSISVAFCALLCMTLTACGGGGGGSDGSTTNSNTNSNTNTPATFDSTEFQGVWKSTDFTSSPNYCYIFSRFGANYGAQEAPAVITATTITETSDIYADMNCSTSSYLGSFVRTSSISWSAGAVAGKTHVAKALVTLTDYSMETNGAPGFTLPNPPAKGITAKALLDVDGALLYVGETGGAVDADGYPTALYAKPWRSR